MDVFVRGNVISFSTTFYDADGAVVIPASVSLLIVFGISKGTNSETIAMTNVGDAWTATWDSSDAYPSTVNWSVRATTPHAADQGAFSIPANPANLAQF